MTCLSNLFSRKRKSGQESRKAEENCILFNIGIVGTVPPFFLIKLFWRNLNINVWILGGTVKTIVCAHASYGPVLYNNHMTMISSWQEIFEKMRLSLILRKFIAHE